MTHQYRNKTRHIRELLRQTVAYLTVFALCRPGEDEKEKREKKERKARQQALQQAKRREELEQQDDGDGWEQVSSQRLTSWLRSASS